MVLAYRLKLDPFRDWVKHELDGYGGVSEVPDYRQIPVSVKISASNGAWLLRGQDVFPGLLPPDLQESASTLKLRYSAAQLEAMKDRDDLRLSVPAALYAYLSRNLDRMATSCRAPGTRCLRSRFAAS